MNIVKKLGLSLVLFAAVFCAQAETETVNSITWTYTVSNGKAEITDIPTSTTGAITIPSTLGGYPVTSIGDYAFYFSEVKYIVPKVICSYFQNLRLNLRLDTMGEISVG